MGDQVEFFLHAVICASAVLSVQSAGKMRACAGGQLKIVAPIEGCSTLFSISLSLRLFVHLPPFAIAASQSLINRFTDSKVDSWVVPKVPALFIANQMSMDFW